MSASRDWLDNPDLSPEDRLARFRALPEVDVADPSSRYAQPMASIQVPVDDAKIIDFLEREHGLVLGHGRVTELRVDAQPPVQNSNTSHLIHVTLTFGAKLGDIEKLAGL